MRISARVPMQLSFYGERKVTFLDQLDRVVMDATL